VEARGSLTVFGPAS